MQASPYAVIMFRVDCYNVIVHKLFSFFNLPASQRERLEYLCLGFLVHIFIHLMRNDVELRWSSPGQDALWLSGAVEDARMLCSV